MSESRPTSDDPQTHELIVRLLEGALEPHEVKTLEELVIRDPAVCRLYATYAHQRCVVATIARPPQIAGVDAMEPPVRAMSRFNVAQLKWAAAFLLLVAGAAVLMLLNRGHGVGSTSPSVATGPGTNPTTTSVAVLDQAIGATWNTPSPPAAGVGLPGNTPLALNSGYAQITFNSGATVVLEAPIQFTLQSTNAMSVASGRLAAAVPPPAHGFAVTTPHSTVTDLGTEFGVWVDSAHALTQVDVFKGQVIAQPRIDSIAAVSLKEGASATLTDRGTVTDPQGAMPQRFVRQLSSPSNTLDVVDLLCGGDGTTHRRGTTIDAHDGRYGYFPGGGQVLGDNRFHPVNYAIASGCFIPNAQTQVDPAGHRYAFPGTIGASYDYIRAGGPVLFPDGPAFSARLGDVDYQQPERGYLLLHCNAGLTIDLGAVRRLYPGSTISRFRAVVGNSAPTRDDRGPTIVPADAFVLVDGTERFKKTAFTNASGPITVDVPIKLTDRYLTLASCSDRPNVPDSIWLNWIILGQPHFDLTTPNPDSR